MAKAKSSTPAIYPPGLPPIIAACDEIEDRVFELRGAYTALDLVICKLIDDAKGVDHALLGASHSVLRAMGVQIAKISDVIYDRQPEEAAA